MAFFSKKKDEQIEVTDLNLPSHIGIIMDGNGRWAKQRGLPRTAGHKVGAETFRKIATYCKDLGVEYLTVYAFSTENWKRPAAFAKTVLMPGDPLRSQFIAETFLENPVLVNNVRGVQGYTGAYKGVPVSVMASGMGMPSIGIYSHELYTQYGVENIIRVGSAGAMRADLELGSVVAGQGACTNSSFADQYELGVHYAPIADFDLLMAAVESARELGVKMPVGNLYSSDTFYDAAGRNDRMKKMGVMAVEMEAAALYCTAAYLGKRALAICSISDNLVLGTELTPQERQTTFTNMMKIGLEAAVKMAQRG